MPHTATRAPLWPQAFAGYPFAAVLLPTWRKHAAKLPEAYQAALDAALAAFDVTRPLPERYQQLRASRAWLAEMVDAGDEHITTQLLRLRVMIALGEPRAARQLIMDLLDQGDRQTDHQAALFERPFLPGCAQFDHCPPDVKQDATGRALGTWLSAMMLETHAHLSAERRREQPQAELPRLAQRRKLPCVSIESERMLALTVLRLGKKVTIKPGSRLAKEGGNKAIWTRLGSLEATDAAKFETARASQSSSCEWGLQKKQHFQNRDYHKARFCDGLSASALNKTYSIAYGQELANVEFIFRIIFDQKKVAVIGSGPEILEEKYGKKIDNTELVVRFNHFSRPLLNENYGYRTDVMFLGARFLSQHFYALDRKTNLLDPSETYFIATGKNYSELSRRGFFCYYYPAPLPVYAFWLLSRLVAIPKEKLRGPPPSSGLVFLALLIYFGRPSKVTIYGFSLGKKRSKLITVHHADSGIKLEELDSLPDYGMVKGRYEHQIYFRNHCDPSLEAEIIKKLIKKRYLALS